MTSGRFWLSCCAMVFGALAMMALISWELRQPFAFGEISNFQMAYFFALLVGPVLYWLYVFYRRRGIKVALRSRPQLSVSAVLIGEMAVLSMVSLGIPLPFEAAEFSTVELAIYIAVQVALVAVWAVLFFRPRQAADGAAGDTAAAES